MDQKLFEETCGIGITISEEEIRRAVSAVIDSKRSELISQRYSYPIPSLLFAVRQGRMKWADGKKVKEEFDHQIEALLGSRSLLDEHNAKRRNKSRDETPDGFVAA